MAMRGAFRYGDALYGTGVSFHGAVSTEGGDWTAQGGPAGSPVDTEGGDWSGAVLTYPTIAYPRPLVDTEGGNWGVEADQHLLIPGDGTTWPGYGQLDSTIAGVQWWAYTPTTSGSVTVDTVGTAWNTVVTVYASNRTTVLGTSSTPGGLASVTASVTAGTTYYVAVTPGTGTTGADGRYLLNAVGPRDTALPQNEFPAPAAPAIPSATAPPSGVVVTPNNRVSAVYPAPTVTAGRPVQPWVASSVTTADWGTFRVVMNGVDVTWFRGFLAQIVSYELTEPWGCGPAQIVLPGITPHELVGTGDATFLIGGYPVDIVGPSGTLWSGMIGKQSGVYDESHGGYLVDCIGDIWAADLVGHQPRTYLPPVDVGSMVPAVLNLVPHRRIGGITQVTTGIKTSQRGSADTSVIGYAQELLATAQTAAGDQWTIARTSTARTYAMQLKDRTTVTAHVRTGQPGVEARLELDSTTATNRIFGRGIGPDGYAWAGWVYPVSGTGATAYPNASPSTTLTVGSTDAGTTSGTGVTDWQTRINETGLATVAVDGTYSAADATAAKAVQTKLGLTVDGVVGPQTWAATFDVGSTGTDLLAAYRAPLAALTSVTPTLTNASGGAAGNNPSDNPLLLVVDRDEDFGDGVTKAQAILSATAELARSNTPGWVGEVVLSADPEECSRFDLREGQNVVLRGWTNRDVTLHIAGVKVEPPYGTSAGRVTLTVDEKARDRITLGAILRRDKDAARNPAMLPPRKTRRSASRPDSVVEYDGESSGGIIPKTAMFGGLWSVLRIPVSQAGKVARVVAATTGPATPFVLAFFGDAVTPADLIAHVGANPLAQRTDGYGPFDWAADNLTTLGFVEALGGPGQACGYSPGYETSPHTGGSTVLTGKLDSTGSWTYQSAKPPWLWLAIYTVASCYISGRIYPGRLDA